MLTVILIILAILLGTPLFLLALFFLLPIKVGVSGFYSENDYNASGFVRAWAGLCGAVFTFDASGLKFCVVLGPWTLWQPKDDVEEESTVSVPPVVEVPTVDVSPFVEPSKPPPEPAKSAADVRSTPIQTTPAENTPQDTQQVPRSSISSKEVEEEKKEDSSGDQVDAIPESEDREPSWWSRLQVLYAQMRRYLSYAGDARPIVMRFFKRLLRVVQFRHADLDLELGIGDPALMGQLFGYVEAFKRVVNKRVRVSLVPDFVNQRFVGSGSLQISIYLFHVIWAVLALIGKGAILGAKVWWLERKAKQTLAQA